MCVLSICFVDDDMNDMGGMGGMSGMSDGINTKGPSGMVLQWLNNASQACCVERTRGFLVKQSSLMAPGQPHPRSSFTIANSQNSNKSPLRKASITPLVTAHTPHTPHTPPCRTNQCHSPSPTVLNSLNSPSHCSSPISSPVNSPVTVTVSNTEDINPSSCSPNNFLQKQKEKKEKKRDFSPFPVVSLHGGEPSGVVVQQQPLDQVVVLPGAGE